VSIAESRIPGFYRLPLLERQQQLADRLGVPFEELKQRLAHGGLSAEVADKTIENAIGTYALPLGIALNFLINGVDRWVPMVVEEPSVVAAASNAAKMVRASGGFSASMLDRCMTGQIELRAVADLVRARHAIEAARSQLLRSAANATPSLVRRGGGPRDLEVRELGPDTLVVHVHVDCQDAMGANLVNTIAEALGPELARLAQAQLGLRILTNLCDRRRVQASCRIEFAQLASVRAGDDPATTHASGRAVAKAVVGASQFAERDPYRAATHNKGVMNGVDSVAIATGNDYRAVEAGAHAYAARTGRYEPLAKWTLEEECLQGKLEMPLALGIVGGTIRIHPTAQLALALLDVKSASELAEVAACAGLASNLAALRALGTVGIQRGHMSLHARSVAVAAGADLGEVDEVARVLIAGAVISEAAARSIIERIRSNAGERP
jgi:hydroxymethylglutaryl-CoA reductase